jgi:hypothetical protein
MLVVLALVTFLIAMCAAGYSLIQEWIGDLAAAGVTLWLNFAIMAVGMEIATASSPAAWAFAILLALACLALLIYDPYWLDPVLPDDAPWYSAPALLWYTGVGQLIVGYLAFATAAPIDEAAASIGLVGALVVPILWVTEAYESYVSVEPPEEVAA